MRAQSEGTETMWLGRDPRCKGLCQSILLLVLGSGIIRQLGGFSSAGADMTVSHDLRFRK